MVAGIPVDQSINAYLNPGLPRDIPEGIDPVPILQRFLYVHATMYPADYSLSTGYGLQ